MLQEKLLALNCHERTEAADFLGSLRPVGEGTFKWIDGVVIQAMKEGRPLLIDEISLASDAVCCSFQLFFFSSIEPCI